jgi:Na+/phosphate symporter
MERLGRGEIVAIAILAVILVLIGVGAVSIWNARRVQIGNYGWIVLGVGMFFSVLVGCGLLAPIFFGGHSGHDDGSDPS